MLARGAVVRVHADGLRQESAALNEPVTAAVTCGRALVGAPVLRSAGGPAPDLPPGLPGDLPSVARWVPSWMALHLGNPDFGAGRADPDVAVEATGRRSRGCGRRSSGLLRLWRRPAAGTRTRAALLEPPPRGPIGDTGGPVDARPGPAGGARDAAPPAGARPAHRQPHRAGFRHRSQPR